MQCCVLQEALMNFVPPTLVPGAEGRFQAASAGGQFARFAVSFVVCGCRGCCRLCCAQGSALPSSVCAVPCPVLLGARAQQLLLCWQCQVSCASSHHRASCGDTAACHHQPSLGTRHTCTQDRRGQVPSVFRPLLSWRQKPPGLQEERGSKELPSSCRGTCPAMGRASAGCSPCPTSQGWVLVWRTALSWPYMALQEQGGKQTVM